MRTISPPPLKRARLQPRFTSEELATLSIFSWNVNGIQPFVQRPITAYFKSDAPTATSTLLVPASLRDFLRRHKWPTCLFLQEVKIAPTDSATQNAVRGAVRAPADSEEPDYEAYFCLPTDKYNARGFGRKVYGVCSIVRRDWQEAISATVRTVEWDLEGRFQIIETEGSTPLSIWNIYAVNGTEYDYKDPETGAVVGTRHDRKLQVHRLMLDECRRLENEGRRVILAGDLNIAPQPVDGFPNLRVSPPQHAVNRADFNDKFLSPRGLNGIDTFRHLHADSRRYTYYPRGGPFGYSCDRVDLIVCSRGLVDDERLVEAGMLDSEAERGTSDHCPLFAKFRWP